MKQFIKVDVDVVDELQLVHTDIETVGAKQWRAWYLAAKAARDVKSQIPDDFIEIGD